MSISHNVSIWQKKTIFINILVTCPPSPFPRQIKNLKTPKTTKKKQLLLSKNSITLHFSNRFFFCVGLVVSSLIPSFLTFFDFLYFYLSRNNIYDTDRHTQIRGLFYFSFSHMVLVFYIRAIFFCCLAGRCIDLNFILP